VSLRQTAPRGAAHPGRARRRRTPVQILRRWTAISCRFGRYTYAVGSNEEGARRVGVQVTRHLIMVYALPAPLGRARRGGVPAGGGAVTGRAADRAERLELRSKIGDETLIRRTGALPTAAFTLSKVAWLARHEPHHLERVRRMLLPHDYLTFKLTNRAVTDRSEASGTGYFDAAANRYLTEHLDLIAEADWLPMLPTVLGPHDVAGEVTTDALGRLGLRGTVLVGAGGGDQHAAALGLGMRPGDVMYSFGTSGVVMTVTEKPVYDLDGFVDGVADMTNGYVPLVSTLNAAKVTDVFARLLDVAHEELSRLALAAPTDDTRPVLAAYLDGERKPNRPGARGLLSGITTDITRERLARAAYEGVIFGLYAGQEHLERAGVHIDGRVIAVGGGARSAAYTQLLSDTVQRPVLKADADEATARGAAVQAAAVATRTLVTAVRDAWAPATTTAAEPRSFPSQAWDDYRATAAVEELDRS
jgi:xylulokinase